MQAGQTSCLFGLPQHDTVWTPCRHCPHQWHQAHHLRSIDVQRLLLEWNYLMAFRKCRINVITPSIQPITSILNLSHKDVTKSHLNYNYFNIFKVCIARVSNGCFFTQYCAYTNPTVSVQLGGSCVVRAIPKESALKNWKYFAIPDQPDRVMYIAQCSKSADVVSTLHLPDLWCITRVRKSTLHLPDR